MDPKPCRLDPNDSLTPCLCPKCEYGCDNLRAVRSKQLGLRTPSSFDAIKKPGTSRRHPCLRTSQVPLTQFPLLFFTSHPLTLPPSHPLTPPTLRHTSERQKRTRRHCTRTPWRERGSSYHPLLRKSRVSTIFLEVGNAARERHGARDEKLAGQRYREPVVLDCKEREGTGVSDASLLSLCTGVERFFTT